MVWPETSTPCSSAAAAGSASMTSASSGAGTARSAIPDWTPGKFSAPKVVLSKAAGPWVSSASCPCGTTFVPSTTTTRTRRVTPMPIHRPRGALRFTGLRDARGAASVAVLMGSLPRRRGPGRGGDDAGLSCDSGWEPHQGRRGEGGGSARGVAGWGSRGPQCLIDEGAVAGQARVSGSDAGVGRAVLPGRAGTRPDGPAASPVGSEAGDDGHLDRGAGGVADLVEGLLEVAEAVLVGADLVHGQDAGLDDLDGGGPAVRAEVGAEDVELLVVGDDRPVHAHVVLEDGVLDEGAELAQEVQALGDSAGVAGALDVHVRAVAAGQAADLLVDVHLRGVQGEVRTALLRQRQLVVVEVEGDDHLRV